MVPLAIGRDGAGGPMGSAGGIAAEKPERMIRPRAAVTAAIQIELLPSGAGTFGYDCIVAVLSGAIDPRLHGKCRIAGGGEINGNIGHITIVGRERAEASGFMGVEQIVSRHPEQHIGIAAVKASNRVMGDVSIE